MAKQNLCSTCANSVYCGTWTEWRCLKRYIRFTSYGYSMPTKCSDYEKRDKNFKEPKCQCESCLDNENLLDEESED